VNGRGSALGNLCRRHAIDVDRTRIVSHGPRAKDLAILSTFRLETFYGRSVGGDSPHEVLTAMSTYVS
jgi:hypothetical protein